MSQSLPTVKKLLDKSYCAGGSISKGELLKALQQPEIPKHANIFLHLEGGVGRLASSMGYCDGCNSIHVMCNLPFEIGHVELEPLGAMFIDYSMIPQTGITVQEAINALVNTVEFADDTEICIGYMGSNGHPLTKMMHCADDDTIHFTTGFVFSAN